MKHRMGKHITAWLLALALCVTAAPGVYAADSLESFADLDAKAWYAPGVRFCLKNGLMNGYGNRIRIFEPDKPMTRAQLVTILYRMAGEPKTGLAMQYNDVPEGSYYAPAARWALAENVMSGYTAITFAPDDPVTREQIAVLLWRFAKYLNGDVPKVTDASYESYGDRHEVSAYAAEAMEWACAMGIITGYRDKRGQMWLMPWGNSSRAVVATMLMRFCMDLGIYE